MRGLLDTDASVRRFFDGESEALRPVVLVQLDGLALATAHPAQRVDGFDPHQGWKQLKCNKSINLQPLSWYL